jgi:hypothetical protein
MSSLTEKIDSVINAVIGGRPAPKKSPTENAALVICELAAPRVKSAMGGRYAEAKKLYADIKRLQKLLNFDLTEQAAHTAYQRQIDEHGEIAGSGGDLAGIARGRSRDAWIADFAARHTAAEQATIKAGKKFATLNIEIGDLVLAQLHDEVAELENVEARQAARFGLPYKSSPTVAALRSLSDYLRHTAAVTILENF